MKAGFKVKETGNLIDGRFKQVSDPTGTITVRSPSDHREILGTFNYAYSEIPEAVASARSAFRTWRHVSSQERIEAMRRFREALIGRQEEFAAVMAHEVGKPLWEGKAEIESTIGRIDFGVSDGLRLIEAYDVALESERAPGRCRYRPLGVVAVIGAFSEPIGLACGHIVPALLSGNTVVYKPSERAPGCGSILADCLKDAVPPGVFNLIQGEREVGRRLAVHEDVNGVLFSGSYEVGNRIRQDLLQQHWKQLVMETGGKNAAIVWDDADLDRAIRDTLIGAFMSAGQRCTSTSRIIVHKRVFDAFLEKFHERAKAFSIGNPLDNPFMGPLIEQSSVDRYMKFVGIATREGAEVIMRGKILEQPAEGNFVTPSICWVKDATLKAAKKSIYLQTEFLAPDVAILQVDELEQAIALANATQYGLVTSVFSASRPVFDRCLDELDCGVINWNRPTTALSHRLPCLGLKKSGNFLATEAVAVRNCSVPVASIESEKPADGASCGCMGLNWKS